ncbi:sulfur carrier protein ThiS [Geomicrobium halophilum]|uniref:Sulfur carrier protein ThiS n=1 Tax=Geomicrobium halophilum TaxID=549000 RepID=A0A841PM03_9BACL|nr:arsenite efflux transporter metallochaperone ArsD [Geomicrobium halophilum]MBB6449779.1 sulfur carrier protein ThiS [Geomicrobium halophilum]
MERKVQIYDPAMCCDTGVCGPSVDPALTTLATAVHALKKEGYDVERYNLANHPAAFAENETVNGLLHQEGTEALPAVLVDGEVQKTGEYPTKEELTSWFELESKDLEVQQPKLTLDVQQVKGE